VHCLLSTALRVTSQREASIRLAQAGAEALIRDHGGEAYGEARQRERDVVFAQRNDPRRPHARALAARRPHGGEADRA
jgi:hypothetical protein